MGSDQFALRLGLVVDGPDNFLQPVESGLYSRFQVNRFSPRFVKAPIIGISINRVLFEVQFYRFLVGHDVVFFEWASMLLARATKRAKRSRIVVRLHSIEVAATAQYVDWTKVDSTIVVSDQMRRRLSTTTNINPLTIHVIDNGVNLERFRPGQLRFNHRIGMLTRVVPLKRVYDAVLSVYELQRQGYPFSLWIGGPVEDKQEPRYIWAIKELIERLELKNVVRILGPIADPVRFYQDIDIFLSNSFWEGQQTALLEAMASGCYCLAHCWGGVEEVLPSSCIFVTDREMQEKLINFASISDSARSALRMEMRSIAELRFDEERMVSEVMAVIEGTRTQEQ